MSEQELRDRLRSEVLDVTAPPGLADAARRGFRRRRARRAVAGAAVAAVAVVGVAVAVRPAPAPVAAAAAEGCVELPPPAAVTPAPGDTSMIGWSYRGDASVRGDVQELAVQQVGQLERVGAGEEEVLEAVPVLGKAIPLAGTSAIRHPVFASRSGRPPAGTCWSARPWSGRASRPVGSPRPSCRCRPRSAGS